MCNDWQCLTNFKTEKWTLKKKIYTRYDGTEDTQNLFIVQHSKNGTVLGVVDGAKYNVKEKGVTAQGTKMDSTKYSIKTIIQTLYQVYKLCCL